MNKKAFTLIELLVVVLIIGILSAIALPQYRLAVAKTHFGNLRNLATSYIRAAQVYYTESSNWPNTFDVLAVQAPGGSQITTKPGGMNSTCMTTDEMYCCINGYKEGSQEASVICGTADYNMAYKYLLASRISYCYVKEDWMEKICKNLGGWGRNTSSEPQTPEGPKSGYIVYRIN